MSLFSDRYELAKAVTIVDDAPRWFRKILFTQAMRGWIGDDPHGDSGSIAPINIRWFIERIAQLTRSELPLDYKDPKRSFIILAEMINYCEWFYFYDLIEIVAAKLSTHDQANSWSRLNSSGAFRENANDVLQNSGIGWQLDESGKLLRAATESQAIAEAQLKAIEVHSPAKVHIAKARLMLNQRPCDAANCIKESVSAIESAGRQAFPSALTLGEVLKEMRRQDKAPQLFIGLIEKLYAFANSEPGVRHGNPAIERVTRAEAEFIFVNALSTISYLEALGAL